jgi:threonine/homoserine/homoserine lactone efflux protein
MSASLLALLAIVLAAMLSPGPDMILITRYATRSLAAAAGCIAGITLGIACHLAFALTGLAAIARLQPALLGAVGVLGACWLAWLGFGALRSSGALSLQAAAAPGPAMLGTPFLAGLLSNLLNVKVLLMMLALFTELLPPELPLAMRLMGAGAVLIEVLLVWGLFAALLRLAPVRERLERMARGLDRIFGMLLLLMAALVLAGSLGR